MGLRLCKRVKEMGIPLLPSVSPSTSTLGSHTSEGSSGDGGDRSSPVVGEFTPVYRTPIMGYEVMEERARFTVFKVKVEHQSAGTSWFVFRRYTDFVRLCKKLKLQFKGMRFTLPPKRWFGDNFDNCFLEDRMIGLQLFVDNICHHPVVSASQPVRDFFCMDDPPGPHDSLEESRALCETLEETVYHLQHELREKNSEVELLKAELKLLRAQQETLLKSMRLGFNVAQNKLQHRKPSLGSQQNLNLTLCTMVESSLKNNRSNSMYEIFTRRASDTSNLTDLSRIRMTHSPRLNARRYSSLDRTRTMSPLARIKTSTPNTSDLSTEQEMSESDASETKGDRKSGRSEFKTLKKMNRMHLLGKSSQSDTELMKRLGSFGPTKSVVELPIVEAEIASFKSVPNVARMENGDKENNGIVLNVNTDITCTDAAGNAELNENHHSYKETKSHDMETKFSETVNCGSKDQLSQRPSSGNVFNAMALAARNIFSSYRSREVKAS